MGTLKVVRKRCSVKKWLNKKQRGLAKCFLASFKAQDGMMDEPNDFLTFKLLSISNIFLVDAYLKRNKNCYSGLPHYWRTDTVLFYQNIHLTLKIYS